jgi:hypothetical protein
MFGCLSEVELLDVMREAQRAGRVALARQLLAMGRLSVRRLEAAGEQRGNWCVDEWDNIAAEVGAELGISRGRASSQMDFGQSLLQRLPKVAAVFAAGEVDFRVVSIVVYRTALLVDAEALDSVDTQVAARAPRWNLASDEKLVQWIDWMVVEVDPEALRVARTDDEDRHIDVTPAGGGMADVWGSVRAEDGAAFDQRLNDIAATVCKEDPRTKTQRRADASGALSRGESTLACLCGSAQCPAGSGALKPAAGVEVMVIADAATVEARSEKPGFLPGYGAVPAPRVREIAGRAKLRPVVIPKDGVAEPQYRPSAALARFIRCRDMGCRWPNCSAPVEVCDVDHTVPYPVGPTHPANCKLYCRHHHLLKTFYCGIAGWSEQQLPDGTLILTTPNGRTATTKPAGALFFPQLGAATGELIIPNATSPPDPSRGLCMPTRQRTRAQDRASRIQWERGINAARYAADPPPF